MSLRNRVTIATVITLGAGLLIVGVALNLVLANRLMADAQTVVENRAEALLATVDASAPTLRVRDSGGDAVLDEQAWVFDASGRAVERPPVAGEIDSVANELASVRVPTTRTPSQKTRELTGSRKCRGISL